MVLVSFYIKVVKFLSQVYYCTKIYKSKLNFPGRSSGPCHPNIYHNKGLNNNYMKFLIHTASLSNSSNLLLHHLIVFPGGLCIAIATTAQISRFVG